MGKKKKKGKKGFNLGGESVNTSGKIPSKSQIHSSYDPMSSYTGDARISSPTSQSTEVFAPGENPEI